MTTSWEMQMAKQRDAEKKVKEVSAEPRGDKRLFCLCPETLRRLRRRSKRKRRRERRKRTQSLATG